MKMVRASNTGTTIEATNITCSAESLHLVLVAATELVTYTTQLVWQEEGLVVRKEDDERSSEG